MRTDAAPTPTRLADYTPPNFTFDSVYLDFNLEPGATRVRSMLEVTRNAPGPLTLDGENIELKSVKIDGKELTRKDYRLTQTQLILKNLPDECALEIETVCDPSANSTLMGLYVSGGRFCTQCEAEGFRRITYFMDRPDVLSVFTVRIEADKAAYPYLLSNGNMTESGKIDEDRHFAIWHDPFPKPCYLFALVAGEFDLLEDNFKTMSGRKIPLTIYVDPGDAGRAEYAMDALKRSMKWDEDVFGREYDLDIFMIVAVRDFNFGAMENKGLNIFNSSLLLADQATATDMNYERIESVVAHEYFHNWTGNRITCRDWFQLCLKEGFTVFRDQEFSADQRGAAVQRIKDVRALRGRQFPEDGGPLAHPVRPNEYMKIDNFYTATIYEKGAEVIRMLKTILGAEEFRKGCDYYFDALDGTASTVEQFIECFEHTSGQDLTQFKTWYTQAGTPHLKAERQITPNTALNSHVVTFKQNTPPTPGQPKKGPLVLPIRWQAIGDNGPLAEPVLTVLTTAKDNVSYARFEEPHTLSVLQDFSAPVILNANNSSEDSLRLMANDPNAFNRWEAGQSLARDLLGTLAKAISNGRIPAVNTALKGYVSALHDTLKSNEFNNAFKALALTTPSDTEITQSLEQSDPVAVHLAGNWLRRAISDGCKDTLLETYHALSGDTAFSPDAEAAGRRALKNRALALLGAGGHPQAAPLAISQFNTATNMTDELSALMTLTRLGGQRVEQSMQAFFDKWESTPLVIDKWFAVQASRVGADGVLDIEALTTHKAYDGTNPNRARALIGGFAMSNPTLFHHISGQGYDFFTRQVLDMDSRNPSVAARLLGVYGVWRKLDDERQALIASELRRVIASKPSKNVLEIATKTLG